MHRLIASVALASLLLGGVAVAQKTPQYPPVRQDDGDWANWPITQDQAWENGSLNYNEFRHSRYFDHYNTIPYKKGDAAEWLEFSEFRRVIEEDFQSADRNGNGRIDNETERCLFHRTAEGRMAGGIGFSVGDISEATVRRQEWFVPLRAFNGPKDKTFSGEWPKVNEDYYELKPSNRSMMWQDIPGCAFMAQTVVPPSQPQSQGQSPTPQPSTPEPTTPVAVTPAQPAKPCTPPNQQEAIRIVLTAWKDGRLTAAEADQLNRGRHCQLDADKNGAIAEAEFVALSLSDFDRADRNKDGVLSGQREIGALANPGSPVQAGLTRKQAEDLAKLRFAILDRKPRDGGVQLDEYLAVTAEEFARNDTNKDGALTPQEAARQPTAQ